MRRRSSKAQAIVGVSLAMAMATAIASRPWFGEARAEGIDASMPVTVVVGPPQGAAPRERVDKQRTGQTTKLPFPAVEKWKRHLGSNIDFPPLVDESGRIWVALTTPEVVVLGPDGKELLRTRIGNSAAIAPPVLTSDGTFVLVTMSGHAIGVSREGRLRFSTPLGMRGRDLDIAPLAREDGSVVFGGRAFVEVDSTGAIRSKAALPERTVGAVLEGPEGLLAVADTGSVYVYRSPGLPRKVGSFGGAMKRGAVFDGKRTLVGVVGGRSVVDFDLPTGLVHVRVGDVGLGTYEDPVSVHPKGYALISTSSGLMIGVDASGNEKQRVFLDKPQAPDANIPSPVPNVTGTGGFFGVMESKPSPPLLVDAAGRVAFARAGGRVGVARADGNVSLVGERLCSLPIAMQPAGEEKLVLACRDGTIWMMGI